MTFDQFLFEQQTRIRQTIWQPHQTFRASGRPNPRALPPEPGPEPWHGTIHGYVRRACRCRECRQANTNYKIQQRAAARRLAHRPHEYAQRAEIRRTLKFFRERSA